MFYIVYVSWFYKVMWQGYFNHNVVVTKTWSIFLTSNTEDGPVRTKMHLFVYIINSIVRLACVILYSLLS
jgi:hypothetical protein